MYVYIGEQIERQHEPGPGKFVGAEGMAKFDSAEKGPAPNSQKSTLKKKGEGEKGKGPGTNSQFSKVSSTVVLYCKYTRSLTFESS
jgi:hypothetical protein